jgi:2-polyprenyl-3-methyl-5-hydroxy-6-metoxy-1,4-benzoquinol methylase
MDRSAKFWDMLATRYDKTVSKFKPMFEALHFKTAGYLNQSDSVLDYGCGAGEITCGLAAFAKEIQGIDISSKMIEVARRKAADRKITNISFKQASIFDEKFKYESFDVILAFNVLHCVDNARDVINRIHNLLKPGGMIITVTPCIGERNMLRRIFIFITTSIVSKLRIFPVQVRFFRFIELENLISGSNFMISEAVDMHSSEKHYFIIAEK